MDDFTQYNGRFAPKQNTPLSPSEVCKTTLFHLCLCVEMTVSFFSNVPAAYFMLEKQKIVSSNRRTQKSRMVETTNDSGQKGPPEHKVEEKVATRESEMVSRASRAVSPLAAIKGAPPRSPQGASLVITSAGHSQSNSSHAYLRLEQWKGGLRASWRKTDPQEKSLESRGWRNRSPPQRSCINRHRGSLC